MSSMESAMERERLEGNAAFADGRFGDARDAYRQMLALWQEYKGSSRRSLSSGLIIAAAKCWSNLAIADLKLHDHQGAQSDATAGSTLLEDPLLRMKLSAAEWASLAPIKRKLLFRKGLALKELGDYAGARKSIEASLMEWDGAKPADATHAALAETTLTGLRKAEATARLQGGQCPLTRPAFKTPPVGFSSVVEAEAAGLRWHSKKRIWINSKLKMSEEYTTLEKTLTAKYAPDALQTMSVAELRAAVEELEAFALKANHCTGKPPPDADLRASLIAHVVQLNSGVVHALRHQHRQKGGGEGRAILSESCWQCKKLPPAGSKIRRCDACYSAGYCSRECQVAHWKVHKKDCRIIQARNKGLVATSNGSTQNVTMTTTEVGKARKEMLTWFQQVPNLATDVMALAWKHRDLRPLVRVRRGANTRLADITVLAQSAWRQFSPAYVELLTKGCFNERYDPQMHACVMIVHLDDQGNATRNIAQFRLQYAFPASEMDAAMENIEVERVKTGLRPLSALTPLMTL